jgi:diguanylate cyclase (GGDEF)-like protein
VPDARLVRLRVGLVIGATFVIALLAGGIEVAIFMPGAGPVLAGIVGGAPWPAQVTFTFALVVAVVLVARIARLVVGPAEELAAAHRDLSQLYESARTHALQDSLTGLANHRAFQEELERQLAFSRRTGRPVALVMIDVDDFKTVNDAAGHAAGDDLLVEMGNLMRAALRGYDRPYRIGGDEFAVLMEGTDAAGAEIAVKRLLAAALDPRPNSAFPRGFAFSAGVSAAPAFGSTRDDLLTQADEALYRAKREGRCCVRLHDPRAAAAEADARALAGRSTDVAEVIASGGLHPVYQPMFDLVTGDTMAFEGLIRLPEGTPFRDPGHLFRAAEATGRTFDLDDACAAAVLAGASAIDERCSLSINLSPATIQAPEFGADSFVANLAASGWAPGRVIVEVTEREVVEDVERLRTVLGRLQALGIRIAADDVGAGNAGLRLLSQVHFDIVKLDLTLVQEGARRDSSLAVVRSLADLAARWGAIVVAEGVETPSQLRMLRTVGIPLAQGYLLARPSATVEHRRLDLEALEAVDDMRALVAPPGRATGPVLSPGPG